MSTKSVVPPQPETGGGQASGVGGSQGGAGASWGSQGGGGASSDGDDPEAEVRQTMQSSDFQKFCSLCQMQGQGDVFAICRQQLAQHAVYAQGACTRAHMHARAGHGHLSPNPSSAPQLAVWVCSTICRVPMYRLRVPSCVHGHLHM